MPDIDLTPMNEAAARVLYAENGAEGCIRNLPEMTAEEKAQTRIEVRQALLTNWDQGIPDGDTVLRYRELALAATLVNWKDIARQAWEQGHEAGRQCAWDGMVHGTTSNTQNPYEERA